MQGNLHLSPLTSPSLFLMPCPPRVTIIIIIIIIIKIMQRVLNCAVSTSRRLPGVLSRSLSVSPVLNYEFIITEKRGEAGN